VHELSRQGHIDIYITYIYIEKIYIYIDKTFRKFLGWPERMAQHTQILHTRGRWDFSVPPTPKHTGRNTGHASNIIYDILYSCCLLIFHHWDFLVKIYLGTQYFFKQQRATKRLQKSFFLSDNPWKSYRKIKSKSKKIAIFGWKKNVRPTHSLW